MGNLALLYNPEKDAESFNAQEGDLKNYDCKECKNKGYIAVPTDDDVSLKRCACIQKRRIIKAMINCGVNLNYTLDNFKAPAAWQKQMIKAAKSYINATDGWLYVGGQVGAGKTHICTAIVILMIEQGTLCKYMMWSDESKKIKACIGNAEEYQNLVQELKTVDVLYIDDFFKTQSGENPTKADINLAFEDRKSTRLNSSH